MAVLASKAQYPSSLGTNPNQAASVGQYSAGLSNHRAPLTGSTHNASYASPTESEFSEAQDGHEPVRSWDERRVAEWLRAINCPQYEQLFKVNNVTGSNLIECDQSVLKEMGIKKIGDRVRIFVAIKQLRTKAVGNHKKRTRDSIAALDNRSQGAPMTPSSTSSPRHNTTRDRSLPTPSTATAASNRYSRQFDPAAFESFRASESKGRPSSPLAETDGRGLRAQRYGARRPGTPNRQNVGMDSTVGKLPPNSPVIRVIYNSGQTKVLDIKNCNTADEILFNVLKKLSLPEHHVKNYCFYTLDNPDQDPMSSHRMSDSELVRVCKDHRGNDRNRLILRKIHAGEPEEEDLRKASAIYHEEHNDSHASAVASNPPQSRSKAAKTLGETWDTVSYPLSPAVGQYTQGAPPPAPQRVDRSRSNSNVANQGWDAPDSPHARRLPRSKIREFHGGRPPSELISQELTTYFPDHQKEAIERTVRMSMRRSARLSRAASRISVASNLSFSSSLKDAPPLPNIADAWLAGTGQTRAPRPLSVSRFALPQSAYRDSIASTSLQPLAEESPLEPNRKSYVSFDSDTQPLNNAGDSEGASALQSYFDESGSSGPTTEAGGSLNDHLSHAIAEDGEEPDEELDSFLKGNSWDNVKWMKGRLIGQGSFGSVFLALHAVTGELMAVKQVEVPNNFNSTLDKKKESMVAALKREIDLLRDLQHENIVQYLGSNSDDEHFNIFLEYVPGGSVAAMLNSYGQLHEPLIRNFVRQILAGLSYLHGRDIIHRDIKGANVLVDNKGSIKISDFGISKRVEASALLQPASKGGHIHRPSLQGSVFWMAPEVVKQTSYTRKADIWSLGCLIVEMFTGTHPFPNCSQLQAIFQIGNSSAKPTTPENASEEGQVFLSQTFEFDHEKRPSADELLLSPFLKQIA